MTCETQHTHTCHNQRQSSRKIKHHHYRIQHLNETSQKYEMHGPTMQCNITSVAAAALAASSSASRV